MDLVATKDGNRIAIEVETGCSNAVKNVRKALSASFDLVVSIAVAPGVKRMTIDALKAAGAIPHPRVRVADVGERL